MQLCCSLTDDECTQIMDTHLRLSTDLPPISNIGEAMAFVLTMTDRCRHLRQPPNPNDIGEAGASTSTGSGSGTGTGTINLQSMEQQLQKLCLPFLRIAALLRHHLYRQELPHVAAATVEYVRLVYYLELVTDSMDWASFNAAKGLCFVTRTDRMLPVYWCGQLMDVRPPNDSMQELVIGQHVAWQQPRLLKLPNEYERLFTVRVINSFIFSTDICLIDHFHFTVLSRAIVFTMQSCAEREFDMSAVRHNCLHETTLLH